MTKTAGDIYVLKAGNGLYKIGRTSNIEARLMQFNIHSPLPLELVFSKRVGNGKQLEDYLHHFFRSRREHGEWFRLSDADLAKLRDIAEVEKVPGRNKGSDKTTVYISPTEAAPLYQLAATLGFVRGGGGNLTGMLKYIMYLVQNYGAATVAAALQPERLAEVVKEVDDA